MMHKYQPVKASTRDICIFCACRFASVPVVRRSPRRVFHAPARGLKTSTRPQQSLGTHSGEQTPQYAPPQSSRRSWNESGISGDDDAKAALAVEREASDTARTKRAQEERQRSIAQQKVEEEVASRDIFSATPAVRVQADGHREGQQQSNISLRAAMRGGTSSQNARPKDERGRATMTNRNRMRRTSDVKGNAPLSRESHRDATESSSLFGRTAQPDANTSRSRQRTADKSSGETWTPRFSRNVQETRNKQRPQLSMRRDEVIDDVNKMMTLKSVPKLDSPESWDDPEIRRFPTFSKLAATGANATSAGTGWSRPTPLQRPVVTEEMRKADAEAWERQQEEARVEAEREAKLALETKEKNGSIGIQLRRQVQERSKAGSQPSEQEESGQGTSLTHETTASADSAEPERRSAESQMEAEREADRAMRSEEGDRVFGRQSKEQTQEKSKVGLRQTEQEEARHYKIPVGEATTSAEPAKTEVAESQPTPQKVLRSSEEKQRERSEGSFLENSVSTIQAKAAMPDFSSVQEQQTSRQDTVIDDSQDNSQDEDAWAALYSSSPSAHSAPVRDAVESSSVPRAEIPALAKLEKRTSFAPETVPALSAKPPAEPQASVSPSESTKSTVQRNSPEPTPSQATAEFSNTERLREQVSSIKEKTATSSSLAGLAQQTPPAKPQVRAPGNGNSWTAKSFRQEPTRSVTSLDAEILSEAERAARGALSGTDSIESPPAAPPLTNQKARNARTSFKDHSQQSTPDTFALSENEARERAALAGASAPQHQRRDPNALFASDTQERADLSSSSASRLSQRGIEPEQKAASKVFRFRPFGDSEAEQTTQSPPEPFDPAVTSQWDILKRTLGERQPDVRRSLTAEEIDAKFEEHRRQRQTPNKSINLDNIPYSSYTPGTRREPERKTCARCGEVGHIARNCPAPMPQRDTRGVAAPSFRNAARESRDSPGVRIFRPASTAVDRHERRLEVHNEAEATDSAPRSRSSRFDVVDEPQQRERHAQGRRQSFDDDNEIGDTPRRKTRSGRFDDEDIDEVVSKPKRTSRFERDEDFDEDDRPRRRGRLEEEDALSEDFEELRQAREDRKRATRSRKDRAAKEAARLATRRALRAEEMTPIQLPEFISVTRLAQTLGVKLESFMRRLEQLGFSDIAQDHVLSSENAGLIAMEYNFDASFGDQNEEVERDLKPRPEVEDKEFLLQRPPIVTIMGHVDHGKTTILDYLRKSSIAATEHGGITQHIGAFSVPMSGGKIITFLDTPGHEAFLTMRQRGANVTDIVVLVVAADDSVKPQTLEALKHAKAAKVPMIVAINKVDKEEADIQRVKQDLSRHGVEIEDYGGDTQVVCVSGKTGQGMDELEDAAVTLSEVLDHRAETDGPVEGWVLEATTKRAGRVATVLVLRGTLSPGDIIVAGQTWARVRTLHNEAGMSISSAGPGTPVEVDGWRDQPMAGDQVLQAHTEQKASDVAAYRQELTERTKMAEDTEAINTARRLEQEKREREKAASEATLDPEAKKESDADVDPNAPPTHQLVPLIVKADVSGSVEAVNAYILQMSNSLCSPQILRSGVGPVSEFDIEHAATAGGHIIAFNLPADSGSSQAAERRGVRIVEQNVIYRIVDDVRVLLEEKLPPVKTQRVVGEAEVAAVFEIGLGGRKKVKIAGCKVRNGVVGRGSRVRVLRGGMQGTKVYDGTVTSLKNVKKDVQEMRKGTECGVGFEGWEDFQDGDVIQTYEEKEEKRKLHI